MTTANDRVSIRLADLLAPVTARTQAAESLGATAKRDLSRYYNLLERDLAVVAQALTKGEALLLCDLNNGTIWDSVTTTALWAQVADADQAQLDAWGVDREALAAKLRALTTSQALALVDAIERWWLLPDGAARDHPASLATVGLQVAPRKIDARR